MDQAFTMSQSLKCTLNKQLFFKTSIIKLRCMQIFMERELIFCFKGLVEGERGGWKVLCIHLNLSF